jgi:cation:H+ antiporter
MAGALLLLVVGLGLLAVASDQFVVGAARLAVTLRVSPLLVGAVIVGFGTGTPELLVSSLAAARGSLDLAVGNIAGSNLANVTLVLGVAGLLAAPDVAPGVIRREAPISLAAVVAFAVLATGGLTRVEGLGLLAALVGAVALLLRAARRGSGPGEAAEEEELVEELEELIEDSKEEDLDDVARASNGRDILRAVLGLAGTIAGAQLIVSGASTIAREIGLSDGFVGLTVVAVGTSLPELVTAVQAARRNELSLLMGNVLGSNVFNSLAVAGAAALIGPAAITDGGLLLALAVMVVVAALAWLFLGLGGRLRRWEAALLLAIYLAALPFTT